MSPESAGRPVSRLEPSGQRGGSAGLWALLGDEGVTGERHTALEDSDEAQDDRQHLDGRDDRRCVLAAPAQAQQARYADPADASASRSDIRAVSVNHGPATVGEGRVHRSEASRTGGPAGLSNGIDTRPGLPGAEFRLGSGLQDGTDYQLMRVRNGRIVGEPLSCARRVRLDFAANRLTFAGTRACLGRPRVRIAVRCATSGMRRTRSPLAGSARSGPAGSPAPDLRQRGCSARRRPARPTPRTGPGRCAWARCTRSRSTQRGEQHGERRVERGDDRGHGQVAVLAGDHGTARSPGRRARR